MCVCVCLYRDAQQWHLLVHVLRILNAVVRSLWLEKHLRISLQTLVSTNKRRFQDKDSGLDLDLSYICDRLIAMAVPGVHGAIYRNDIKEVARFFAMRHYASFCVVSLVENFEEKFNGNYDPALLYGQVQRIPFHDHSAPALKVLVEFCEKATAFLNVSSSNVLAVHCRGGKGRTGTFCSALMRWVNLYSNTHDSKQYYARRRTLSRKTGAEMLVIGGEGGEEEETESLQGVDAPSQHTILRYLDVYMKSRVNIFAPPQVLLSTVTMRTLALYSRGGCRISLIVFSGDVPVYDYAKAHGWQDMSADTRQDSRDSTCTFDLGQ